MHIEEPGGTDAESTSLDNPVYQVTIYERLAEPAELPEGERGYCAYEWKLHDAEVSEVLAWAGEKAGESPYTVEVASVVIDGESHLLRLCGHNPTRGSEDNVTSGPYALSTDVVPDQWWNPNSHTQ
jgi:hypothetical protein